MILYYASILLYFSLTMISWSKVRDLIEGNDIALIAGGPSIEFLYPHVDIPVDTVKVCVNNGIYAYPKADILITMDSNLYEIYNKDFSDILTDLGCPFIGKSTYSGEYAFDILGHFKVGKIYAYGFDLIRNGIEGCGVDGPNCKKNTDKKLNPEQLNNVIYTTMRVIDKYDFKIQWI
jgi:hypothetical protein